jgi:hypothetical protein
MFRYEVVLASYDEEGKTVDSAHLAGKTRPLRISLSMR